MSVKVFGFVICPLELITGDNGKLALTKLWTNVAYAILSYKMMITELTWDLMTAYGSIVGGSFVAAKFITMKYGGNDVGSSSVSKD